MTKEEQWIKESIENYIFAYTGKRAKISDADAQHFTACVMSYLNLCTPSLPSNLDEAANMYGLKSAHGEDNYCAWWHRDGFKAGAEWAQQMKEVCGFQNETYTGSVDTISHIPGPRRLADSDEDEHTVSSLDSAAEEYAVGLNLSGYVRVINAFKAGAEWMDGQGVTKNGLVAAYDNGYLRVYTTILDNEDGIKFGDKVIIQIRKK